MIRLLERGNFQAALAVALLTATVSVSPAAAATSAKLETRMPTHASETAKAKWVKQVDSSPGDWLPSGLQVSTIHRWDQRSVNSWQIATRNHKLSIAVRDLGTNKIWNAGLAFPATWPDNDCTWCGGSDLPIQTRTTRDYVAAATSWNVPQTGLEPAKVKFALAVFNRKGTKLLSTSISDSVTSQTPSYQLLGFSGGYVLTQEDGTPSGFSKLCFWKVTTSVRTCRSGHYTLYSYTDYSYRWVLANAGYVIEYEDCDGAAFPTSIPARAKLIDLRSNRTVATLTSSVDPVSFCFSPIGVTPDNKLLLTNPEWIGQEGNQYWQIPLGSEIVSIGRGMGDSLLNFTEHGGLSYVQDDPFSNLLLASDQVIDGNDFRIIHTFPSGLSIDKSLLCTGRLVVLAGGRVQVVDPLTHRVLKWSNELRISRATSAKREDLADWVCVGKKRVAFRLVTSMWSKKRYTETEKIVWRTLP